MKTGGAEPPKAVRQLLSRLLSGPRGREVLHELDANIGYGAVGAVFATALLIVNGVPRHEAAILLGGVLLLVLLSGMGAAVGPARRGLRTQPVDALRLD